jgi:serine/threonine-protein kinase
MLKHTLCGITRPTGHRVLAEAFMAGVMLLAVGCSGATANPTAIPIIEKTLTLAPGVTMTFVRVPAGEFLMGSTDGDKDASDGEKPQSKVSVDEFWIGKYDVTNAQFRAFSEATGYKTTAEQQNSGWTFDEHEGWHETKGANWRHPRGPDSTLNGKDNHPVVQITWDDAVAFAEWAAQSTGKKIAVPTEAQWEKAARGTDGRFFPWGNQAPDAARLNYNQIVMDTTEVGKYSPAGDSPYGAADMAGNVWQWTSSLWGVTLEKPDYGYPYHANDGREDPSNRNARVLRGGGYFEVHNIRCAVRLGNYSDDRGVSLGFRVVATAI